MDRPVQANHVLENILPDIKAATMRVCLITRPLNLVQRVAMKTKDIVLMFKPYSAGGIYSLI